MKSIRSRLISSYFLIIALTVLIIEIFLILSIRQFYYVSIEDVLSKQGETYANFYNKYLSSVSLQYNYQSLLESLNGISNAEIQILDKSGRRLIDSSRNYQSDTVNTLDVKSALSGKPGKWTGKMKETGEKVLAVSFPLNEDNITVGAVRFITSLEGTDLVIRKISLILLGAGVVVLIVVTIISFMISSTITVPVKEITDAAEEMTKGHLQVKIKKRKDDELGRLSDTLNFMAEEILKSEQLKNEFIASISHELRTPLTSIKGWAVTLSSGSLYNQDELLEGLTIIERESDRLSDMVGELLDFSRFASGRISLNMEEVDIKKLLYYVIRQEEPRARHAGIDMVLNCSENIPLIKADSNRVKQVLINIIDNSIKFTKKGGKIKVSAEESNGRMIICIQDTGCGISEKDLPYVKKKFYKGSSKASGSGIGLALCDEIIKLHDGKFNIESEEGKGTKVFLCLNL